MEVKKVVLLFFIVFVCLLTKSVILLGSEIMIVSISDVLIYDENSFNRAWSVVVFKILFNCHRIHNDGNEEMA